MLQSLLKLVVITQSEGFYTTKMKLVLLSMIFWQYSKGSLDRKFAVFVVIMVLNSLTRTMAKFCYCNNIMHETTISYTLEQNSITERAIAIFFEMVQSMLYIAGISLCYWGEAFTYAVHIWALCSTTMLNSIVPYEAQTGCKPDIFYLYIFGLLKWAHVPKQVHKGKLESQAIKVRMLGQ